MGLYAYFARDLPDPGTLAHRQLFQTARIYDRSGKLLQEINDPQGGRRILVPLSDIPMVMRDATIAAEDASFYDNPGFDIRAVVRATYQWVRSGAITQAQRDAAYSAPLKLVPVSHVGPQEAPHFVTHVRQLVEDRFGTEALFREGLQITTSLDLDLQHLAEKSASEHIVDIKARNATNAALVAIQPSSGEVMAMLGSVKFDDPSIAGQVNVALSPRQPGSTLKPFTYVTAVSIGWTPATLMLDI